MAKAGMDKLGTPARITIIAYTQLGYSTFCVLGKSS